MIKHLFQAIRNRTQDEVITIVSGLPRSGTSMMMKMLEAGGLPLLIDNIRTADVDNPKGYYEFERVKKLSEGDDAWLEDAQGKAVKIIATLLVYLPTIYTYRLIFMHRAMPEILASQRKMLLHRGEDPEKISDAQMAKLFEKHLARVNDWVNRQQNLKRIDIGYNQLIEDPGLHVEQINQFLGRRLNLSKMVQVVDPKLYRQRQNSL